MPLVINSLGVDTHTTHTHTHTHTDVHTKTILSNQACTWLKNNENYKKISHLQSFAEYSVPYRLLD